MTDELSKPVLKPLVFSPARIFIIASNTVTELVRQKVFNVLLVFGLVIICSSSFWSEFSPEDQFKFMKDFCLGAMVVIGAVMSVVGTAMLLPQELEQRTVYTILSKPVYRIEFLLGKFFGQVCVVFAGVAMMTLVFGGVLYFKELSVKKQVRAELQRAVEVHNLKLEDKLVSDQMTKVENASRDMNLVKAILLMFVNLLLISAITLCISSFSNSLVFTVVISFMIIMIGNMQHIAREAWAGSMSPIKQVFIKVVAFVIPDLQKFNVADDIIVGRVLDWGGTSLTCGYGLMMTLLFLAVAWMFFEFREV
ncbi:MAG: hypothetical protein SGI71_05710 [Verrucomicrobiota bacterium]|nr:hypothetical protein [Verrucomicrobiota bacterium]